jgi:Rha family phage regulatory protein
MTKDLILKPRIAVIDGEPTTTSLAVAEHFGKNHFDVLRSIKNLECSEQFNQRNFAFVEYTDAKGEKRPMYRMTKNGFAFLVMGFTGKKAAQWKEAYINAFDSMDRELSRRPRGGHPAGTSTAHNAELLLRLQYALDHEYGQAALLWLLIGAGAIDNWVSLTYREIEAASQGFLGKNGANKAARKLSAKGLIEVMKGEALRHPSNFKVFKVALDQLISQMAALEAPGLEATPLLSDAVETVH